MEERVGVDVEASPCTAPALSELYQQHLRMLSTQDSLQKSSAALCSQLHAVGQENLSLHQQLLELRRAHKALKAEYSTVVEQLQAAHTANQELQARVLAQTQLLASAHLAVWPHQPPRATLNKQRSARQARGAVKAFAAEQENQAGQRESGSFGGLDLIGEAIEQMESEDRQEPEKLDQVDEQLCCADGSHGSDHSAAGSALRSKHSGASTPEQVEVGWAPEHALPAVEQLQMLWPDVMELAQETKRGSRNAGAKGRAAPKRGPAAKGRTPARKKSKY